MNKDELLGGLRVMRGHLLERIANLLGDPVLRRRAQQLQLAGRVQRTMGEARALIQRSLKQHLSA